MHKFFMKLIQKLCHLAVRRPYVMLLLAVLISVPAVMQFKKIKLKTNLLRLLPDGKKDTTTHRDVAYNTRTLVDMVNDGGHFSFLLQAESADEKLLLRALRDAVSRITNIPGVLDVNYTWPVEFIKKYRLLLIPNDSLNLILDKVLGWKAQVGVGGTDILDSDHSFRRGEERAEMESNFKHFANFERYHKSKDGKNFGIKVRTKEGVSSLGKITKIFNELNKIATSISKKYKIWAGVGGSHRNKVDEYKVIARDLSTTGIVSAIMIALVLLVSFRSLRTVVIVLLPLFVGLLWGFAFVPMTVGSLNIITAFLLLIMFGMGIDYSIHLVKRFQTEHCTKSVEDSLVAAFTEVGSSVIVSGFTTALSLFVLAASNFKGFSEFGIITALATVTVLIAMFVVLPSLIVVATKIRFIKARSSIRKRAPRTNKIITIALFVMFGVGGVLSFTKLGFDMNFRNLQFDKSGIKGLRTVQGRQHQVYASSFSPGALYFAPDLKSLDKLIAIFDANAKKRGKKANIGRYRSIRNFSPSRDNKKVWNERVKLIKEIQSEVKGRWTKKLKKKERKRWVKNIRDWTPPINHPVPVSEYPSSIMKPLITKTRLKETGKYGYLFGVHPAFDRKNGRNAMAFTKELYDLNIPASLNIKGPVGETNLFAEILWIVQSETALLIGLTFLGVFLLIWVNLRSARDALLVLTPLITGVFISFGVLVIAGIKLNFFSVVVVPALLGMGVDDGVHYFRHWKELKGDTDRAQKELFEPLSVTTITTMLGYSGMMFANHPGIRSIGIFACIGLFIVWGTSLFLLPGILKYVLKGKVRA